MFLQFIFSFLSTLGFAILFNIPKKAIIKASIVGGTGWIAYVYSNEKFHSLIVASFIGACIVAIISEIFARKFKETVTVFIIPGIIPLVPGAGMYYTMLAVIKKDFDKFATIGSETMFVAGGIATAILIVSSITRMIFQSKENKKQKI
ncbi:threonine/serine exporter family protein [Crassaminicella indica]|uniref:Threonine/serine exporter family protein n=1 Tax=Crassaminicella indica TaxID=2855394 RepID=A0ABX8RCB9_9CLOT|nr:threonine/serine exporter family protein [Crassaminicella indica]QXM05947.1 threonine/serine exporter family protein [Crassaminicella indica]